MLTMSILIAGSDLSIATSTRLSLPENSSSRYSDIGIVVVDGIDIGAEDDDDAGVDAAAFDPTAFAADDGTADDCDDEAEEGDAANISSNEASSQPPTTNDLMRRI